MGERIEDEGEERQSSPSSEERGDKKNKRDMVGRNRMARLQGQHGGRTGGDNGAAKVDEVASTGAGEEGLLRLAGLGRDRRDGSAGAPDPRLGGSSSRGGGNQRRSDGGGGDGRVRTRGGIGRGRVRVLAQTELSRVLVAQGGLVDEQNAVVGDVGLVAGRLPQERACVGQVLGDDGDGHDVLARPAQELKGDGARGVGIPGDLVGLALGHNLVQAGGEDGVALGRLAVVGLQKLGRSKGHQSGDRSEEVPHGVVRILMKERLVNLRVTWNERLEVGLRDRREEHKHTQNEWWRRKKKERTGSQGAATI